MAVSEPRQLLFPGRAALHLEREVSEALDEQLRHEPFPQEQPHEGYLIGAAVEASVH